MLIQVVIVGYDARWPGMYEAESGLIQRAIGDQLVAIEHVGSTAVPGLAAKPIIDIMGGVRRIADATASIEKLEEIGYEYAPEHEDELPERRYFDKSAGPPGAQRTYHLHVVEVTSDFWQRHLLFRDYLRVHPDVASDYETLKRHLSSTYRSDRAGYSDAKTSFIQKVEERARVQTGR